MIDKKSQQTLQSQEISVSEIGVDIEKEIFDDLAREIQKEIDLIVVEKVMKDQGWYTAVVSNTKITDEWCEKNIKSDYKCIGNYWFFSDRKDYTWFIFNWGSK